MWTQVSKESCLRAGPDSVIFEQSSQFASNKLQNVANEPSLQISLAVVVAHPLTCSERLTVMILTRPLTVLSHKIYLEVQQAYV